MTRLLVSVRNAAEARIAMAGRADLIDVKEPARGPLGAADPGSVESVVAAVAGSAPVSVALGELLADKGPVAAHTAGCDYAKFGLAGCIDEDRWTLLLGNAIARLPPRVAPVAVAYADWLAARAPEPWEVLRCAKPLGCRAVLIDTFDKLHGTLLRHMTLDQLASWVSAIRRSGLKCVVAGSLGVAELRRIAPLEPDYVGVRGAACRGGRGGKLDGLRLHELHDAVHGHAPC